MRSTLERLIAAFMLIALLPVFVIVAVLIWLESGRPILFRQARLGRNGAPFSLLKFRSMLAHSAGASITVANDSRITRLGGVLRRYKIDELPQLWNIVRGEMQFIGPRPEVPKLVNPESDLWKTVLMVRPGLTDLASLVYRHEESVLAGASNPEELYRETVLPDKLALSSHYQARRSWRSDLTIILLTARYSLVPAGFDPVRIRQMF